MKRHLWSSITFSIQHFSNSAFQHFSVNNYRRSNTPGSITSAGRAGRGPDGLHLSHLCTRHPGGQAGQAAPQGGGAQRQSNPLASPNCNYTECPPCNLGTGPSRAGSAYYLVQCEGWAIPFHSMNSSTEWRLPIADNAVNSEIVRVQNLHYGWNLAVDLKGKSGG